MWACNFEWINYSFINVTKNRKLIHKYICCCYWHAGFTDFMLRLLAPAGDWQKASSWWIHQGKAANNRNCKSCHHSCWYWVPNSQLYKTRWGSHFLGGNRNEKAHFHEKIWLWYHQRSQFDLCRKCKFGQDASYCKYTGGLDTWPNCATRLKRAGC